MADHRRFGFDGGAPAAAAAAAAAVAPLVPLPLLEAPPDPAPPLRCAPRGTPVSHGKRLPYRAAALVVALGKQSKR